MKKLNPTGFTVRHNLIAVCVNLSLRFTFFIRIARQGGFMGRVARGYLLSAFSSDVTPGPAFSGGIYAPHPTGIVIGQGARFQGNVSIYQGVTFGADKFGGYPLVEDGCKIFPQAIVLGSVRLGRGCTVGAAVVVDQNVADGEVVRR